MKRIWLLTLIVAAVVFVLLDLFLAEHIHVAFPGSDIPGVFSLFGFLGCLVLIGFAKLIGHYWLQRGEDYYDNSDDNE